MDKKINEVANLFGVSVPTLHYWEKEGLFTTRRNEENSYRQYGLTDIFNIWEIALYRDLDIPIRNIREILHSDLDLQMQTYHEQQQKIAQKIKELRRVQKDLEKQVRCGDLAILLNETGPRPGVPDMTRFLTDPPSIEHSLAHPNDMGMLITESEGQTRYIRGTCLNDMAAADDAPSDGEIVLLPEKHRFMEFLLKVNINDHEDNNIPNIRKLLQKQGFHSSNIWARYLLMGGGLPNRYEYYHGWIEVE